MFFILHLCTFNRADGGFHHLRAGWRRSLSFIFIYSALFFLAAQMNEIYDDAPLKEASDATEAQRRKDVFKDRMSLCRIYFYLSSETDCFFFGFFFIRIFGSVHYIASYRSKESS